ncbi:hypothetical protein [Chlorogloea sp. CCALA 695]|uniref:hypothetical protein n=1 Tax=Chlorogloea sp. CCALA 695 TaxID=2107693 RepID=UPI000D07F55C|nr:hypothetical protein [Chlorogloea sp. CCALA 695]PSB33772.1 hypothetical protein C7B70_05575 [Chlorogloea sp. CCALA 695]
MQTNQKSDRTESLGGEGETILMLCNHRGKEIAWLRQEIDELRADRKSLQSRCNEQAVTIDLLKAKVKQQKLIIGASERVIKEIIHSYHRED